MILPYFLATVLIAAVVADTAVVEPPSEASCQKLENEIFIKGGPPCQQTCKELFDMCTVNTLVPVDACYCKPGYARTKDGKCTALYTKKCICEINFYSLIATYFSSCLGIQY